MSRRSLAAHRFAPGALALAACLHRAAAPPPPDHAADSTAAVTISVVGTNDLHGHVERLPWLGGALANLRAARARDPGGPGGVLLVDAGDMFQGTLASNPNEGAAVVRAYGALGYAAVAVGNHEFDFGPVGPAAAGGDDPRGALKARAREARFPFLAANLVDETAAPPVVWSDVNIRPSTLVELAGVRVGLVGVTTLATPRTTLARNFVGLAVAPLEAAIAREARALRAAGAVAVVALAHEGGRCRRFDDPADETACDADGPIFAVARRLPPGLVDLVVAGHTHAGVAHRIAGLPIIESFAEGRAFGRADLVVDRARGRVRSVRLFPPRDVCGPASAPPVRPDRPDGCAPEPYEGAEVHPDEAVARLLAGDLARARALGAAPLGVHLPAPIRRSRTEESPLGNLLADLMRAARPGVDAAITNGGGLRADLPAGPLTYGALFEAFPFDNVFAHVTMRGAALRALVAGNLARGGGILSISGLVARARCAGGALDVRLSRPDGAPVRDDEALSILTNDFLASGGDALFPPGTPATLEEGAPIREVVAALLRARGGTLRVDDPAAAPPTFDPARPRLDYPGPRPVRCGPPGARP